MSDVLSNSLHKLPFREGRLLSFKVYVNAQIEVSCVRDRSSRKIVFNENNIFARGLLPNSEANECTMKNSSKMQPLCVHNRPRNKDLYANVDRITRKSTNRIIDYRNHVQQRNNVTLKRISELFRVPRRAIQPKLRKIHGIKSGNCALV